MDRDCDSTKIAVSSFDIFRPPERAYNIKTLAFWFKVFHLIYYEILLFTTVIRISNIFCDDIYEVGGNADMKHFDDST